VIASGLATALGRLPPVVAAWLGRRLGDLLFVLLSRRRRIALDNLRAAFPELDDTARRRLARGSCQHLGLMAMELCAALARPLQWTLARIEIDGIEALHKAVEGHGRALLLTGHLGNWELLSAGHRLTGYSLAVVARALDSPGLDVLARRLRGKTGVELIDKRRALRPVLAALRSGRLVGILLDQNAARDEAVFVPFFGILASTSRSMAVLALRTGSPVVPVFIHREPGGRHRVTIEPPLPMPADTDREAAVRELTALCAERVEAAIRRAPEQWLWMHDRWRTRPPEERPLQLPGRA
jgi:KDO2-lipid IV(A) lauroyltransferase